MITPDIEQLFPSLSPEQQQVITHVAGPLLVIAGPGSGKSLTLILRAINLLALGHAQPQDLLVSTFSRGAAQELAERFAAVARSIGRANDWSQTPITTIHQFCAHLLREHGRHIISPEFQVLDDIGRVAFLDSRLPDITTKGQRSQFFHHWRSPADAVQGLARAFDQIVDRSVDPKDLIFTNNRLHSALGSAYLEYQCALRDAALADFSHLLRWSHDLLEDPDMAYILSYNAHVMVDEWQDTNILQERIFRRWTSKSANLMVVGDDDDQSIYGFRGARPNSIVGFADRIPGCRTLPSNTNHRSHAGIVQVSAEWIKNVSGDSGHRCVKDLTPSELKAHPDYSSVLAVDGNAPDDEAQQLAGLFAQLMEDGVVTDYSQVALLLHSVRDKVRRPYTDALQSHGIPYQVRERERFFGRPEIRALVGAFALIFDAVAERPDRKQSDAPFDLYLQNAMASVTSATPEDSALNRALSRWPQQIRAAAADGGILDRSLHDCFYCLMSLEPFDLLQRDPASTQYLSLWSQCIETFHTHYGHRQISAARISALRNDFFGRYLPLLYLQPSLQPNLANEVTPGQVQIMTVHQSKGRELPVAAVGSLAYDPGPAKYTPDLSMYSSDLMPTASGEVHLMEPARCKYTAFTRAENLLILTGHDKPAPMLNSLWQSLPRWSSHTRRHLSQQRFLLKPRPTKRTMYSVTGDLAQYQLCPRRYQYFAKRRFAEPRTQGNTLGNVVHGSINAIHHEILAHRPADERKISQVVAQQCNAVSASLEPEQPALNHGAALRQVSQYVKQNHQTLSAILASEQSLQVEEADFTLTGRVDLLTSNDEVLEVTDFKTGHRAAVTPERRAGYRQQLLLYAHLAERRCGKPVARARLYWTSELARDDAEETFAVSESLIDQARQDASQVAAVISSQDFTVHHPPSPEVCRSCPLQTVCRRDGTIPVLTSGGKK